MRHRHRQRCTSLYTVLQKENRYFLWHVSMTHDTALAFLFVCLCVCHVVLLCLNEGIVNLLHQ